MIHVVDTHALLWYLEGSRELGQDARRVLAETTDSLILPTIVLAEARYAIARQRSPVTWGDLLTEVGDEERFLVHPLDMDILRRVSDALEMHDAIVCATALTYHEASGEPVPVITKETVASAIPDSWRRSGDASVALGGPDGDGDVAGGGPGGRAGVNTGT